MGDFDVLAIILSSRLLSSNASIFQLTLRSLGPFCIFIGSESCVSSGSFGSTSRRHQNRHGMYYPSLTKSTRGRFDPTKSPFIVDQSKKL